MTKFYDSIMNRQQRVNGTILTHWVTHMYTDEKMACHLIGAKPFSEPMMAYCQFTVAYLDHWGQNLVTFEPIYLYFHSIKCIWQFHPKHVDCFLAAAILCFYSLRGKTSHHKISQATGLDAWASRVKCPARFVSHLHDICIYMSCL